jgi:MFS family permease
MHEHSPKRIGMRAWFVMAALALTGQIAWAVENAWFNTFVYDTLTPDPRPVAWMVAASAVTATLTTLLVGALSDRTRSRWGRRRPYILFGYILWGLSTILFPTVAYIRISTVAIIMVVAADSIMTFFGSTANDAAFNAWTADIAESSQRGRVEGVLNMSMFGAQIISMVAAGMLIDRFGYFVFFYALGGIVMLVGLVAGSLLRDAPFPESASPRLPYWQEIASLFKLETLRKNRNLFVLLLFIMVSSIASQVSMPYLIIYLENYVGLTKSQFSLVGSVVLLGSALLSIPFGFLADKMSRRVLIFIAIIVGSIGNIAFSLVESLPMLMLTGFFSFAIPTAGTIATIAWLKDLLPEEDRGKFLGIRMIFWIAIPMVVGPWIGSLLIQNFGIPTTLNDQAGFIPVPIIFQVGALINLLALIPLFFMQPRQSHAAG